MIGFVAAVLVACGNDSGSNSVTDSDEESSSSVCKNCDDLSSSKVKSSSSKAKSSSLAESSSSLAKSSSSKEIATNSSSSRNDEGGKSSSSDGSSSSSAKSSSSVVYVEPCKTDSVDTCKYGTLTDERDGQTYKTVTIGTQTWMAENLNYAYTDVPYSYNTTSFNIYTSDSTSWCYRDSAEYCTKYGRLYTWAAAMDSVGKWSTNGKGCGCYDMECSPTYPVRGICPEGWHLPTETELKTLFTAVGGKSTAGKMLKSASGWNGGNGSDAYSFAALPGGCRDEYGRWEGGYACFWGSTKHNTDKAYGFGLYRTDDALLGYDLKHSGFSVRCVKD